MATDLAKLHTRAVARLAIAPLTAARGTGTAPVG